MSAHHAEMLCPLAKRSVDMRIPPGTNRVSQRGNRKLNHALHLAAICQIRNAGTGGRIYFERKVDEGKTKKDAIRSLKRHVSNAVYRKLLDDHRRREM